MTLVKDVVAADGIGVLEEFLDPWLPVDAFGTVAARVQCCALDSKLTGHGTKVMGQSFSDEGTDYLRECGRRTFGGDRDKYFTVTMHGREVKVRAGGIVDDVKPYALGSSFIDDLIVDGGVAGRGDHEGVSLEVTTAIGAGFVGGEAEGKWRQLFTRNHGHARAGFDE
jgi:hypothetical protein